MPQVEGFVFHKDTGDIEMYAGDTGSFLAQFVPESGDAFTEHARLLFTIKNGQGEIMMQRLYRLDDQWDLGDGVVFFEFHNDDTDEWDPGMYSTEMRIDMAPIWDGSPIPTARCVNALASGVPKMIEGVPVRTVVKGTLQINSVDGRI